jgi:NadR type nicotinamide-nucleotide adenylyltransferase
MNKYKIGVLGPESSGKSILVKKLALFYNCISVPEFAREYIESLNRPYQYDDIILISKRQREIEKTKFKITEMLLICDSTLITSKVWSYDKFDQCDQWIEDEIQRETFDLYLLCRPDIKWENDPVREDEKRREHLFEMYLCYLAEYNFNFKVIEGQGDVRSNMAIRYIDDLLNDR